MQPFKFNQMNRAPDISQDPAVMDLQGRMPKPSMFKIPGATGGYNRFPDQKMMSDRKTLLQPANPAQGNLPSIMATPTAMSGMGGGMYAPRFNTRPQSTAVGDAIGSVAGPIARQLGSTAAAAMASNQLLGDSPAPIPVSSSMVGMGAGRGAFPRVGPEQSTVIGEALSTGGQIPMNMSGMGSSTGAYLPPRRPQSTVVGDTIGQAVAAMMGDNASPVAAKMPAVGSMSQVDGMSGPAKRFDPILGEEFQITPEEQVRRSSMDRANERRDAMLANISGMGERLAADGNAQLGFNGQQMGSRVDEGMAARMRATEQMGSAVPQIGGVVRNGQYSGGDTAYAGSSPLTTGQSVGRYSNEEMARRAGVAERVAANAARQLSANESKIREMGREPGQDFIGPRRKNEDGQMVPMSNYAAARAGMTPEQLAANDMAGSAARQRMEDSAGMRAQRAQARRGFMTNSEGDLDLLATAGLGMQRNNPRGALGAFAASQAAALAARKQGMAEQEMAFAQDPQRFQEQLQLAQLPSDPIEAEARKMELEEDRLSKPLINQGGFAGKSEDEQRQIFYGAAEAAASNPGKAAEMMDLSGVTSEWLTNENQRLSENPTWMFGMNDTQKADYERQKAAVQQELSRRGISSPKLDKRLPWLWDTLSPDFLTYDSY